LRETPLNAINEANVGLDSVDPQTTNQSARLSFLFVLLFTIAIYARPEDIFPALSQFHLTFILGLCAGLTYLASFLVGSAPFVWTKELRIVLLLTVCFVAGIPFAYWKGGSFQVLTEVWLKTLFIFFLLTQTLVTLQRIRRILWAIVLSELVVCAYSVIQSSHVVWVDQRLFGVNFGILGWNFLGLAAALTIPYIAAINITQPGFVKTNLLISCVLFLMWMLVLTASRSGLLNVLLSIALTSLFVLRGTSRGKFIGVGIVVIALVAITLAPTVFWQRMGTVWSPSDYPQSENASSAKMSGEERLGLLKRSLQYTFENPIFGLGLGNFAVASGAELATPEAWLGAHNTFTELSSEAGIPALALFIALLWTAIRSMKALGNTDVSSPEGLELRLMARATWVSLLSFVFGAFFAHIAYEYFLYYPVAVAAGVQQIAKTLQQPSLSATRPLTSAIESPAMDWSA
jgi:O-antigen ligase